MNPGKLSTSRSEATLERTLQYAIQIADALSWILFWPSCKLPTHRPTSQPSPQNRPTSLQQDTFWKPVDGSGEAEVLTTSAYTQVPTSWSHNGVLSYAEGLLGQRDFWVLSLEGDRNHKQVLATQFDERHPVFSPNGKCIVFTSNQSGRDEVCAKPYPGEGEWQHLAFPNG